MSVDLNHVRRLEDRTEIFQLFAEYSDALDADDHARYASAFAAAGTLRAGLGEATGPAAIEALLDKKRGPAIRAGKRPGWHVVSNIRVDVADDGESARATALWSYVTVDDQGAPIVIKIGRYLDEHVREDGGWRLKLHEITKLAGT